MIFSNAKSIIFVWYWNSYMQSLFEVYIRWIYIYIYDTYQLNTSCHNYNIKIMQTLFMLPTFPPKQLLLISTRYFMWHQIIDIYLTLMLCDFFKKWIKLVLPDSSRCNPYHAMVYKYSVQNNTIVYLL